MSRKLKQLVPGMKSVIAEKSGAKADMFINDGDVLKFGQHKLEVRATPGHTDGCVSYVSGAEAVGRGGREADEEEAGAQ